MNPIPSVGIIIGFIILRPLKAFMNHGSTLIRPPEGISHDKLAGEDAHLISHELLS